MSGKAFAAIVFGIAGYGIGLAIAIGVIGGMSFRFVGMMLISLALMGMGRILWKY